MNIEKNKATPIQFLVSQENNIYIKREDLIQFSFGGNKARKASYFFEEIDKGNYDSIVTYGSSSSNHCRVVSNLACKKGITCIIISPKEASIETFNSKLMKIFGALIIVVPVEKVHDTIEKTLEKLKNEGKNPYFIPGGGHGNLGTQAYVDCYNEIKIWEKENKINFDYIFLASGTGTTQAGLVCGKLLKKDNKKIIGISIARKNPRGKDIIIDSIKEYIKKNIDNIEKEVIFIDDYIGEGYANSNKIIDKIIDYSIKNYGIPLDSTYTGKAFYGMNDYIKRNGINNKNILFIHTGGTPLFFDYIKSR